MANVLVINLTIYISLILEMLQSKNDNNCPVVFKAYKHLKLLTHEDVQPQVAIGYLYK